MVGGTVTPDVLGSFHADLDRIRELTRRNPQQAMAALERTTITDPIVIAVLRAELLLRIGQPVAAVEEAARAARLAEDGPLEAPATTVLADVACTTGRTHQATRACTRLVDLSAHRLILAQPQARQHLRGENVHLDGRSGRQLDDAVARELPRIRLATILTAVATYHDGDCRAARARLHRMRCMLDCLGGDRKLVPALAAGVKAMDAWCTPPRCRPAILTRPLDPVLGGLLQPDPAAVTAAWFSDRIRARACAGTHFSGGIEPDRTPSTGGLT